MSTKEFREFFTRIMMVSSGTTPDQEPNYPIQSNVDGKLKYNRFLEKNYPTEGVFKKLFASIPFFLNSDSAASATQQGLAKVSSTDDIANTTTSFSDSMVRFVSPHQVPTFVDDTIVAGDVVLATIDTATMRIEKIKRIISGSITKIVYRATSLVTGGGGSGNGLSSIIYNHHENIPLADASGTYQVIDTYTVDAVDLSVGAEYEFEVLLLIVEDANTKKSKIVIGGVTIGTEVTSVSNTYNILLYKIKVFITSATTMDWTCNIVTFDDATGLSTSEKLITDVNATIADITVNDLIFNVDVSSNSANKITLRYATLKKN